VRGWGTGRRWNVLASASQRTQWEREMTSIIGPLLNARETQCQQAQARFGGEDSDVQESFFVAELNDTATFAPSARALSWPGLWRFRPEFQFADFVTASTLNPAVSQQYPVLSKFLMDEPQLRGLEFLPAVMEFQAALLNRFSRRLDMPQALDMSMAKVVETATDPKACQEVFSRFARAWNAMWPFITSIECEPLNPQYRGLVMGDRTPLAFCLPTREGAGMCVVELARELGRKHNALVTAVDEYLLLHGQENQRAASLQQEVGSGQFVPSHAIRYDMAVLETYVRQHCVLLAGEDEGSRSAPGQQFDFARAEQFLIDTWLSGLPMFRLEQRLMVFIGSDNFGSDFSLAAFRTKVKQDKLPPDAIQALTKELTSPVLVRAYLELIETAVLFLQETGGTLAHDLAIGDKSLGEYMLSVLMLAADERPPNFGAVFPPRLLLKHTEAVYLCMQSVLVVDPMARAAAKYKSQLDMVHKDALRAVVPRVDLPVLVRCVKECVTDNCVSESIGAASRIKDTIGEVWVDDDQTLREMDWFDVFPDAIPMAQIVETCAFLSALLVSQ
jgi:hypothetical protein